VKRTSVIRYSAERLAADAGAIIALAEAEGLYGHAEAVRIRSGAVGGAPAKRVVGGGAAG
jgi:histidinol dehydrogenase